MFCFASTTNKILNFPSWDRALQNANNNNNKTHRSFNEKRELDKIVKIQVRHGFKRVIMWILFQLHSFIPSWIVCRQSEQQITVYSMWVYNKYVANREKKSVLDVCYLLFCVLCFYHWVRKNGYSEIEKKEREKNKYEVISVRFRSKLANR